MQQTKLSVFCDKLIEAGWLLAAVMAPLFFDVYSSRVFEPDKITLVRSLAVVMSAAWLVRVLETGLFGDAKGSDRGEPVAGVSPGRRLWDWLRARQAANPLTLPTLFLVLAYLISTLASVSQVVSLWGSYQRLQGTYSTFSYIVISALVVSTMRRREQVERLVSVMLFVSLPASLYGMVQHFKLEFLPWAGDVTTRVTSSMGNAIFIAAWLIMVVPLTLSRFADAFWQLWTGEGAAGRPADAAALPGRLWAVLATLQGVALFVLVYEGLQWYAAIEQKGETFGSGNAALVVLALGALVFPFLLGVAGRISTVLSGACYFFLLLVQLDTILFAGSRGPWIGLIAGAVVFGAVFMLVRRLRWLFYGVVALGVIILAFLGVLNMPNTPLQAFKETPNVGRLGSLLETEGGTGKVRVLIWEGALQLIKSDPVRTLIGYGPESMYVAYNRFYPPDLAHYEARNASPDRSHNETYDALIITGVLGFFAYWVVFYTFFYHAMNLLGLTLPNHRRWLYGGLLATGVIAFAMLYAEVLPLAWSPLMPLLGVGALGLYLLLLALVGPLFSTPAPGRRLGLYQSLVLALFAAVLSHFVEIQFGIAIASTRTYFWLYAALVVVLGGMMAREQVPAMERKPAERSEPPPLASPATRPDTAAAAVTASAAEASRRVRRAKARREGAAVASAPQSGQVIRWPVVVYAMMAAVVLATVWYDFVVPQQQATPRIVLALVFGSWLIFCLVTLLANRPQTGWNAEALLQSFLICSLVTWLLVVVFAALHPARFVPPSGAVDVSQFITYFCVWLGVLMLGLAVTLFLSERSLPARSWRGLGIGWAYGALAVVAVAAVILTNLNVIVADIYYKTGDAYDKAGKWEGSIPAYQKALNLTPSQDFYYLFLGRAFMELAKRAPDAQRPAAQYTAGDLLAMRTDQMSKMSRADMLNASLASLLEARRLNPLNTDHTANLGRLYRFWGEVLDPKMLDTSLDYYRQATDISPNTAHLYDEWALVYFIRGQYPEALARLQKAASLDAQYAPTFVYLGDAYQALNQPGEALQAHIKAVRLDPGTLSNPQYFSRQDQRFFDNRLAFYQQAGLLDQLADAYRAVLAADPQSFTGHYTLGYILFVQTRLDDSVREFELAEKLSRDDVATHSLLGYLYAQQGRLPEAVQQNLQVVRLVPSDLNSHRNLAILYQRLNMITQAISETQTALKLLPNDPQLLELLSQLQQQKK